MSDLGIIAIDYFRINMGYYIHLNENVMWPTCRDSYGF